MTAGTPRSKPARQKNSGPALILASRSPRRAKLLAQAGIRHRVIPSRIEEISSYKRPAMIVRELAYKKALSVALKYPGSPVLGSDTLVYCKGKILGKPENKKDALRLLRLQNGSWQAVHTGVALIWLEKGIFLAGAEISRCKARRLSPAELKDLSAKHHDKAGAYAVQDADDEFVEKIEGRFDTVVGLSMNLVRRFLKKAGVRSCFLTKKLKSKTCPRLYLCTRSPKAFRSATGTGCRSIKANAGTCTAITA